MFRQIGPTEILLILGVVLLLFGGRKLPELARGSGRALRIFKSEVSELQSDDDKDGKTKKDRDDVGAARLEAAEDVETTGTPSPTARDTRPDQV